MFEEWTGVTREVQFENGDVLALYTDGATDALDAAGDEFGIDRLVEVLRTGQPGDAQGVLDRTLGAVRDFGAGEQFDDITLVVAKVLGLQ